MLVKRIRHIFGIRNQKHLTGFRQSLQSCDHRHQFHAVIRRFLITGGILPLVQCSFAVNILQNRAVAAGAFRISPRSAVRVNRYFHIKTIPFHSLSTRLHRHMIQLPSSRNLSAIASASAMIRSS